jgi:hypothetical protein
MAGYVGDGGPATSTSIHWTTGVGNIYFSDENGARVRKVTASTGIVTTIAGDGVLGYNGDGILATSAELCYPCGIAIDLSGNVYFADFGNQRVRGVSLTATSTPTITWNTPASITYGTALSSTQLNATASVPGTFAYSPAAGSILGTDLLVSGNNKEQ